jgi:glutaredoxin 2
MQVTLYHYVHCPFCVRVRIALGFLNIKFTSKVLQYDDERTPIDLCDIKMLPIADINGLAMNESLDIITKLDVNNILKSEVFLSSPEYSLLEKTMNDLATEVYNLAMPYWSITPEFNATSKKYFEQKKSKKRGPFKGLVKKSPQFITSLNEKLNKLESSIEQFYLNDTFGIKDIILASHIWGLYTVPEFQFSTRIHAYLQRVRDISNFNYHEDFWN